jgi:hypothetical protein
MVGCVEELHNDHANLPAYSLTIKMDLEEVGRGCGDWMELAQDRDR